MKDCICPSCMYGSGMLYNVVTSEDPITGFICSTYSKEKAEEVASQIEGATIVEYRIPE